MATTAAPRSRPGGGPLATPGRWLRDEALHAPAFLVLGTAIALTAYHGGYGRSLWSVVGLFTLALLVIVLLLSPAGRTQRTRLGDLTLLAFGALVLWSYASILWADVPGDAWEGANRLLLYWLATAIVGLFPWSPRAARAALAFVVFGLAAAAAAILAVIALGDDPTRYFVDGRLSDPVGYANALANLWLIGFFPALHLAIDRDAPMTLRGLALASATLLLELSLLSQSRGSAVAFAAVTVVFVALHPRRWPALAALAVPVLGCAVHWDALTGVRLVADSSALDEGVTAAARAIVGSFAVADLLAVAAILGAARLFGPEGVPRGVRRTGDRVLAGVAALLAVAAVGGAIASSGWLSDRWTEFSSGTYAGVEVENRFTGSLGSGRYDFYRVALNEWRAHPVAGIGIENFAVPYLEHRRTLEAPRYVHSLGIGLLAQLGLVGALICAALSGLLAASFLRLRRHGSAAERGLAVGALTGGLAFLVHGMADWLWAYPTLAILAAGLLTIGARLREDSAAAPAPMPAPAAPGGVRRSGPVSGGARVAIAVGVLVAGLSLALPGVAARYQDSGFRLQRTDPAAALSRFQRAADYDPLTADALVAKARIEREIGRRDQALADLREALGREPRNWFTYLSLGLVEAQARQWPAATAHLSRAAALNPRQPVLIEVRELVRARKVVDPREVERAIAGQLAVRLQPFSGN